MSSRYRIGAPWTPDECCHSRLQSPFFCYWACLSRRMSQCWWWAPCLCDYHSPGKPVRAENGSEKYSWQSQTGIQVIEPLKEIYFTMLFKSGNMPQECPKKFFWYWDVSLKIITTACEACESLWCALNHQTVCTFTTCGIYSLSDLGNFQRCKLLL